MQSGEGLRHGSAGFNVIPLARHRAVTEPIAVLFFEAVKCFRDDVGPGKPVRGRKEVLSE